MSESFAPKVSVCVVTYNQEKYITQCLQSLVDQETDFPFEVIVSDDCSRDSTPQIIQDFARRYPTIIRPILHQANMGAYRNLVFVHEQAKGEYVAHMDGDDYTLPGKLAAQVKYLDMHPRCNIALHRMYVLYEDSDVLIVDMVDVASLPKQGFSRSEVIGLVSIGCHSAKMYRAIHAKFPLPNFPVTDYFANVEHVADGFAAYVDDKPLGVYRAGIGIASSGNATRRILQQSFLYFLKKFPSARSGLCMAAAIRAVSDLKSRRIRSAIGYLLVAVKAFSFVAIKDLFKNKRYIMMFRLPRQE